MITINFQALLSDRDQKFFTKLSDEFTQRFIAECALSLGGLEHSDEVCTNLGVNPIPISSPYQAIVQGGSNLSPNKRFRKFSVLYLQLGSDQFCGVLSFFTRGVRLTTKGGSFYMPFVDASVEYDTQALLCSRLLCRYVNILQPNGSFKGASMGQLPCYSSVHNRIPTLDALTHTLIGCDKDAR